MKISPIDLYKILLEKYGNLNWWPMDRNYHEKKGSDPRFEVITGAVLTQNTAWSNVEKALEKLKSKNMLHIKKITQTDIDILKQIIKPTGFYNQKAERLQNLAQYLQKNYNADLDKFFNKEIQDVRDELLSLNGIGKETADSILLYAGNKPIFVVDAYTKRICQRIPIATDILYDEIQKYFQKELSKKYPKKELSKVYNELHALIVILAKEYCKKKPNCTNCPLNDYCVFKKQLFQ